MRILTFSGRTPTEALKKAQEVVGEDAMLIETRELQKKSLGKEPLYEIVVAIDDKEMKTPRMPKPQPLEMQKPVKQESEDVLYNISKAAQQISEIAKVTQHESFEKSANDFTALQEDLLQPKELGEIKAELTKLGDRVKLIQNMFWEERSPNLDHAIPSEFAEIYKMALESGMNKEHLDEMMHLSLEHMPLKMRENSETVKRYFKSILRKMVPVRMETLPTPNDYVSWSNRCWKNYFNRKASSSLLLFDGKAL
jgi:flagellar biosynthesis protein FlhF